MTKLSFWFMSPVYCRSQLSCSSPQCSATLCEIWQEINNPAATLNLQGAVCVPLLLCAYHAQSKRMKLKDAVSVAGALSSHLPLCHHNSGARCFIKHRIVLINALRCLTFEKRQVSLWAETAGRQLHHKWFSSNSAEKLAPLTKLSVVTESPRTTHTLLPRNWSPRWQLKHVLIGNSALCW